MTTLLHVSNTHTCAGVHLLKDVPLTFGSYVARRVHFVSDLGMAAPRSPHSKLSQMPTGNLEELHRRQILIKSLAESYRPSLAATEAVAQELGLTTRSVRRLVARFHTEDDHTLAIVSIGKQTFKIGRLLKANPELGKAFEQDKTRVGELMVVVSRHPYDIARMRVVSFRSMPRDGLQFLSGLQTMLAPGHHDRIEI